MLSKIKDNTKGFTLIEVVVVILIIGVLSAAIIPSFISLISKTKETADKHMVNELNKITVLYLAGNPSPNEFIEGNYNDSYLLQVLVDNGFLNKIPTPQQKDNSFNWSLIDKIWYLEKKPDIINNDLKASEIIIGTGGYKGVILNYLGHRDNISIPKIIDNKTILGIYQDAFSNKGLDTVSFASDSSITRIHARAFKNNNITEILLPASLTRIDYGAFLGNYITKVTIGSGVLLESKVFQNSDSFKNIYSVYGAGTYTYNGTIWIKSN